MDLDRDVAPSSTLDDRQRIGLALQPFEFTDPHRPCPGFHPACHRIRRTVILGWARMADDQGGVDQFPAAHPIDTLDVFDRPRCRLIERDLMRLPIVPALTSIHPGVIQTEAGGEQRTQRVDVSIRAFGSCHRNYATGMNPIPTGSFETRRRKLFHLADEIGLTRDERIELAQFLLRRDITSWSQLDAEQVDRMLDCAEGFLLVTFLLTQRVISESDPSRTRT